MIKMSLYDKLNKTETEEEVIQTKYLTFTSAERVFAIPIVDVVQIIHIQDITGVPEYPPYVKGVIDLRGEILPIIDLRLRFSQTETVYDDHTCIIITRIEGYNFGLIIEQTKDFVNLKDDDISNPPHLESEGSTAYLSGIAKANDDILLIMDTKQILSQEHFKLITSKELEKIAKSLLKSK